MRRPPWQKQNEPIRSRKSFQPEAKATAVFLEFSAVNRGTENQDDSTADFIWGSFNKYNDVVEKLERNSEKLDGNLYLRR